MKKLIFLFLFVILSISSISQTIPSYVPTNALVLWFPFNNSILNQGGLSTTGTSTNFNSSFVKDRFNRPNSAIFFNQTSSCATRIENSINGSFINGAMSLSFWVNRDSAGCDNPRILNIDATNGTRLQLWWNNNSQSFTF